MKNQFFLWLLAVVAICGQLVLGQPQQSGDARITLSLEEFNRLKAEADKKGKNANIRMPYSIGATATKVYLNKKPDGSSIGMAVVDYSAQVEISEKLGATIPFFPHGTQVEAFNVNSQAAPLMTLMGGLSWVVSNPGKYTVDTRIRIPVLRENNGFRLDVPVLSSSVRGTFEVKLPGEGLNVSVIPSYNVQKKGSGSDSSYEAEIPTGTRGVQISWSTPVKESYVLSQALYTGVQKDKRSVSFEAEVLVDLFDDQLRDVPLFPQQVTLEGILVDGQPAPVISVDDKFGVRISGKGRHRVKANLSFPVKKSPAPGITMFIPRVPVTRVQLQLDGERKVSLNKGVSVEQSVENGQTLASFYIPMNSQAEVRWTEAVPQEASQEFRAHAQMFHSVIAEEGLVSLKALLDLDITRGDTNLIELSVPTGAEINRVISLSAQQQQGKSFPAAAIADWRLKKEKNDGSVLQIFLKQKISGAHKFLIDYDTSLSGQLPQKSPLPVPLLTTLGVGRQKGLVALLGSKSFELQPLEERNVSRVGENQIPPAVRAQLEQAVSHTFKYIGDDAGLKVRVVRPARKDGKIDAMVQTLVSLGDVSLKVQSTVIVNVKSGSITSLALELPAEVSVLGLTAPSLRNYEVKEHDKGKLVQLEFTQEMEGQFAVNLSHETILPEGASEVGVPTMAVKDAEVEQGRIAVEALSNVEVQPALAKELSTLDPKELPQQLVLKTTNPILMAYKYAKSDRPYQLNLSVLRHREVEVQQARIDLADYRTLVTKDGVAVTFVHFKVRNTRRQFLKVSLPKSAQVWSVKVDGKNEKPAIAEKADGENDRILIKIRNSMEGFPVTLVYQHDVAPFTSVGVLNLTLPTTDLVISKTNWLVYLSSKVAVGEPESNLRKVGSSWQRQAANLFRNVDNSVRGEVQDLPVVLPSGGVHTFHFEKLYAHKDTETPYFKLRYASEESKEIGLALSYLGALLILAAAAVLLFWKNERRKSCFGGLFLIGALAIALGFNYFLVPVLPAFSIIAGGMVLLGFFVIVGALRGRRKAAVQQGHSAASESVEES